MGKLWRLIKCSYTYFMQAKGTQQAAALAFYTLFSLAPLLIIAVAVGSLFLRDRLEKVLGQILNQASQFLSSEAVEYIYDLVEKITWHPKTLWATLIGFALILYGTTTVFSNLKDAFNELWSVRIKPENSTIKDFLRTRLFSLIIVLFLGLLAILLFILSAFISGFDQMISEQINFSTLYLFIVNNASIVIVIFLFLLTIFKLLPDVKQDWSEVLWGALATTVLLLLGKYGISLYLSYSNLAGIYGAAGSLVVLLLWVYYSAMIVLFGACIVRAIRHEKGKELQPRRYAGRVYRRFE